MGRACSKHGQEEEYIYIYIILVGESEGKRPLGGTRRGWEDNFKMDLRWVGLVWTGLFGLRIEISGGRALVNTEMNHWVS
jgi:hypothetical protein